MAITLLSAHSPVLPRAVLFDLDQTLIQHTVSLSKATRQVLLSRAPKHEALIPEFESSFLSAAGELWDRIAELNDNGEPLLRDMLDRVLLRTGFSTILAAEDLLQDLVNVIVRSSTLTTNALVALDALAFAGIRSGIITNGFTFLQLRKAAAHGLLERVEILVTSEQAGAHKPDRKIFDLALRQLGIQPAEAWYVGDNLEKDIYGAAAAGLRGVLFSCGRRFRPSDVVVATMVIDDLLELMQLLP
jgi:putative hydrolase of the HAD superfamily